MTRHSEMATAQPAYEGNDTVDDTLLNQISKYVFYDELSSMARDLEVRETEIRKIRRVSSSSQEQIFKVRIVLTVTPTEIRP